MADASAALQSLYGSEPVAKMIGEKAKAVLVFPSIVKAGFIVGGQYGEGVLFENGKFVAHYNSVAASYGLQAGVQKFGYALFLALREMVPRESHGVWKRRAKQRHPIDILKESNKDEVCARRGEESSPKGVCREGAPARQRIPVSKDHRRGCGPPLPAGSATNSLHVQEDGVEARSRDALEDYRLSLPDQVRVLFDRYRLEDIAMKVVGIGSVGTRCLVGLFFSAENHPCSCNSKRPAPRFLHRMRARASIKIRGRGLSWGSG